MRKILTKSVCLLLAFSIVAGSFASPVAVILPHQPKAVIAKEGSKVEDFKDASEVKALSPDMLQMGVKEFLSLTPSKYKEMTGQKLGIKKSIELKMAQKALKNKMAADSGISKGVYILLAILGLGFVGIGLLTDWKGSDWIVNLVLTLLCWLPGVIHALIKMKNYYN